MNIYEHKTRTRARADSETCLNRICTFTIEVDFEQISVLLFFLNYENVVSILWVAKCLESTETIIIINYDPCT